jgi:hypothetical protein
MHAEDKSAQGAEEATPRFNTAFFALHKAQ